MKRFRYSIKYLSIFIVKIPYEARLLVELINFLLFNFSFRIVSCPEIVRAVQERLGPMQEDDVKDLAGENARLEVELATLQSQVTSLTSQHTAQKLANSQLVAEKDEVNIIYIYIFNKTLNL